MVDAMRPSAHVDRIRGSREPYTGPRPFGSSEAAAFFGRASESAELVRLWQTRQVTLLYGKSGVGKSSLLSAGAYPRLIPAQADLLSPGRITRVPSAPQPALAPHNPYTLGLLSSWSPGESYTGLAGMTVRHFLRVRPVNTDRYGRALPILASIDQAEDLFRGDPDYCQAMVEELREALDSEARLRLLLSVREDHLDDLIAYEHIFAGESTGRLQLRPLEPQAAIEAVRRPIENSGRYYADGAAEALIDDLRPLPVAREPDSHPGIEPALLQVACEGIWRSLPAGQQVITADHIRSPAGVSQSLANYVGRVLAETADEYDLSASELRSRVLAGFGAGGAAEEGVTHTAGIPNSVLHRLQDRYLLQAEWNSGTRKFRLQHDRLIAALQSASISPLIRLGPGESLLAAERALDEEDVGRGERLARRVADLASETDIRVRAEAESILGNIAYVQGAQREAADHYRDAASLFEVTQDTEAVGLLLAALGRTEMVQGHHLAAIDALQSAVERIPADAWIQTTLARTLWGMGKSSPAMSLLNQVLSARGDMPEALRVRAEIMTALGDTNSAIRDRDRAAKYQAPSTRAARALALAAARELNAAEQEIGSALEEAPDNGPVLLYAAQIQVLRGDSTTAADLTRRAIAAEHPPLRPPQRERARRILRQGAGNG